MRLNSQRTRIYHVNSHLGQISAQLKKKLFRISPYFSQELKRELAEKSQQNELEHSSRYLTRNLEKTPKNE